MKNNLELKTTIRFCYWCKQTKEDFLFAESQKHYHNGRLVGRCRECSALKNKEYRAAHRDKLIELSKIRQATPKYREADRKRSYQRRYGISQLEYEKRLAEQDQSCFLCGVHESAHLSRWGVLCLDHDHTTKKLRRFLCARCNKGLGCFNDNPDLLEKAAKYILSFKGV